MRYFRASLSGLLALLTASAAVAQTFPTVPAQSVIGRLGVPGDTGPSQPIPFATLAARINGSPAANRVWAGPTSGGAAAPTFRALVGADLPNPAASSLGGVQSKTCSASNWLNALSTGGVFGCSQPSFADLTSQATLAQLPTIGANTALCSIAGGTPIACTKTQITTLINPATAALSGALPAWPNNTTTYFRGDGTYVTHNCAALTDSSVGCAAARGQLPGETTTGSATAGNVGEYVEGTLATGSATSLTTATAKTITSISLTAGDWDVSGTVYVFPANTTTVTLTRGSFSTTTNTLDTTVGRYNENLRPTVTGNGSQAITEPMPPSRFSLSATTTVFLVGFATFGTSTCTAFGIIRARRVR